MGLLRIYRKFYMISLDGESDNYNLIDPYLLSAETYVSGSGNTQSNTLIETSISIGQDSSGIYYADLNPKLYSNDFNYDIVWYVQYTETAPSKKLITRFRVKTYNIASKLDFEISQKNSIEYEISKKNYIEYEIVKTF